MTTDLTKLPPPPKGVQPLTPEQILKIKGGSNSAPDLSKLPPPPKGVQGMTLPQLQLKIYADQSANPAITDKNPIPSWWSKVIAGTPLAPADATDTKYDEHTSWTKPFVTSAKMLANVFSDAPAILAAIPTAIIHPINTVTGLVGAVKGITDETTDAISTGLATGDWSQLGQDVQETEVSVMNHPLQTVLLLDEALKSSKNVLNGFQDKGFSGGLNEMVDDTSKKVKGYINDIDNAQKNIRKAFTTKSTITNHLSTIQQTLSDKVASMKTVDDLKEKLNSFTEKPKSDAAGIEEKVNANAGEQEKLKNQLAQEQEKLDTLNKQHMEQTNKMAADQQAEMKIKGGFESQMDMGKSVSNLFKRAFDKASAVYDEKLGNAKVQVGNILDSLSNYKDELLKGNKFKSADVAQKEIDQLKLRQIVGEGGSESDIYKKLQNSDVNPKLFEKMNLDQLKARYQPLTSDYLKTAKNSIYNSIEKGADESSLREYNETVLPSFDEAFGNAIKDEYGQDTFNKIKETDALWSEFRKNPLSSIENPTLNDIQKNWKSFLQSASKIDGGKELITKIQNSVGQQILSNAERGGEYSANKIQDGIKKYGSMLDDTTKNRITNVANSISDTTSIKSQEGKIGEVKTQIKESTQQGNELEKQHKKIVDDSKAVGNDSADVEKNIMKIDSMEKLQNFLKTSGKTIKEVTPVIVHALIEQADKEAGKPSGANYDLNVIDNFIAKMDKLGGETSGGQEVNDALLGGKDSPVAKSFNELKDLNEKYKLLDKTGQKSMSSRVLKAAFGAFLAVGGLGFGRFKGISDIRSAFSSGIKEAEPSGRARVAPDVPFDKSKILKYGKAGAILNVGQKEDN